MYHLLLAPLTHRCPSLPPLWEIMRRSTALKAAAAALLLLSMAAAYMSIMSYWERSEEEETHRMFVEWMAKCNKTYNSTGEEEHRYAVFKENFRRRGPVLNIFGDWTDEELHAWHSGGCLGEGDLAEQQVPDRRQRGPDGLRPLEEEGSGGPVAEDLFLVSLLFFFFG